MELYAYEFTANSKEFPHLDRDDILEIVTCQRSVILSTEALLDIPAIRSFAGAAAYDFLLRFACGLESQIKGETDVFGQIKAAYKDLCVDRPQAAVNFHQLFLKLLEDTKDLRANYLHGIGGNTYGALARRLLSPTPKDQVLILGAGQISKSVAPYFTEANLTVYNRTDLRLNEIQEDLSKKGYFGIQYIQSDAELQTAFQSATLILICTPPGSELDTLALQATLTNPHAKIFHFGAQASALEVFQNADHLKGRIFSLTELFEMEKSQGTLRDRQVAQALEACRHRAILRSMSRSIHIAHGWEDLTAFN